MKRRQDGNCEETVTIGFSEADAFGRCKASTLLRRFGDLADADYAALVKEAKTAKDITLSLTKILEGMPTDCGSCSLKSICDEVEGMRELHFGKEHHTTE